MKRKLDVLTAADFDEPTMIVVVNRYWDPKGHRPSLEDCARGYWYVGTSGRGKAYKCKRLLASYNGEVVGVYEIDQSKSWMDSSQYVKKTWPDDRPKSPKRRACELLPVPTAVRAKYLHCSTAGLIRPRSEKSYYGF